MKKIITIILLTLTFLASAQTATDNTVVQASKFISAQDYSSALKTLEKANKNDYRVQYFLIVTEFKVLQQSGETDYYSVNKVRDKVKNYLTRFSSKDLKFTQDVKDINFSLDDLNPAKNVEEYLANEKQKEKIRIEKLKAEKLKVLQEYLSAENYQALKTSANSYETVNLLEAYQVNYFKSTAEFGLLKMNDAYEISDVQSVKKQLSGYLSDHGTSNSFYSNSIQTDLNFINENFASTQEDLISKREKLAAIKYKQKLKMNYDEIKQNYLNNNYSVVVQKAQLYPTDSEFSEEVNYYKVLSHYSVFMESKDIEFNDISQVSNHLQEFVNNKKFTSSSYKKNVEDKLTYVNTSFPKSLQDFNAKKEQEQQALAKKEEERQREIKKQQRKIASSNKMHENFVALGYEGGTIAKYGLRFEVGGKSTFGFFLNARTSLISDEDLSSGVVTENKNEVVVGPSIKITPWMFLNVGGGYGYYKFPVRNDYEALSNLETKNYFAGYGGVTFRLGNRVNLVGGASFIDITEEFYAPEYTFGLTINLK